MWKEHLIFHSINLISIYSSFTVYLSIGDNDKVGSLGKAIGYSNRLLSKFCNV